MVCKTPKYIFASTSTIPENPFGYRQTTLLLDMAKLCFYATNETQRFQKSYKQFPNLKMQDDKYKFLLQREKRNTNGNATSNEWPMQNTSTAIGRCRYFGLSPKFVISPLFLPNAREIPARVCSPRRT